MRSLSGLTADSIRVEFGKESGASIEVLNLLGEKYLDIQPVGEGQLADGATIPLERTESAYDIVGVDRALEWGFAFEAGPFKLAWWLTDDLGERIGELMDLAPFEYREEHNYIGDEGSGQP